VRMNARKSKAMECTGGCERVVESLNTMRVGEEMDMGGGGVKRGVMRA
jgi:hypothetical protein